MKRSLALFLLLLLPTFAYAQPSAQPEPRSGHDLVWHDKLGMVLLVNGDYTQSDQPGKIWGWDGKAWQVVSDDAPPVVTLGGAAYDSKNDLLVLYGGSRSIDPDDFSDMTWTWDGASWTQVDGETPGKRDHFSMVYDVSREEMVLYGGNFFPTNTFFRDTWVWNGAWTQAATAAPDTRLHYTMAYDSAHEQALVFGGSAQRGDLNDLWAWDGKAWNVIDTGTGPSRRSGARMAFDEADGMMVLFGGRVGQRPLDDTWLWDGTAWTKFDADDSPPARSHHAMAYDPVRQKIVLFGGYGANDNLSDTWEWDMTNGWVNIAGA